MIHITLILLLLVAIIYFFLKRNRGIQNREENSNKVNLSSELKGAEKNSLNTYRFSDVPEENEFLLIIFNNVAEKLSEELKMDINVILGHLDQWYRKKSKNECLSSIQRIECCISKKNASTYLISSITAFYENHQLKTYISEQEIEWEYLPKDTRSDFIKNGENKVHYILCE
jgi:hypothetical protein